MVSSQRLDSLPLTPEAQIMPKFAATLASLLLIASSIGVNIARYPQVGRPVDTRQRTDSAESADSAPAAQQLSRVETSNPASLSASETEIQPAKSPQSAVVAPTEIARVEEHGDSRPATSTPPSLPAPPLPILDVRPMVPVTNLRATADAADSPTGYDEVRRLPPVERGIPAVADLQTAGTDAAAAYPATSTP